MGTMKYSHSDSVAGSVHCKEVFCLHDFRIHSAYPGGNSVLKVNNRNTRTKREICSKLTIKISERR